MRRKDDTLKNTLLLCAREISDTEGIETVNIRSLAKKAGIATGTVYNYFSSKEELLLALTEEYWKQALLEMRTAITAPSFCGQLEEIFGFLRERIAHSAGKLMSSLSTVEAAGQESMKSMQAVLEAALLERMEQDTQIRMDIWDETFTKEQFARFIRMHMIILLKAEEPELGFFITMIRRIIY